MDLEDSNRKKVAKWVDTLNKSTVSKAFRQGIGALQDELWRLCHEEGVMIEDEERQITELLTKDFI